MTATRMIDGAEIEYLLRPGGRRLAVLFHGGHMRAALELGQEVFADAGCSVLQPSRPGYGATPLGAGPDPAAFSDRTASLCEDLGYQDVIAVGVSGGGRTAMTFAARHPRLVRGLILESSLSFLPWPDGFTQLGAKLAFRPHVERATWAMIRVLFGLFPDPMLRGMLRSLSTRPAREVFSTLSAKDRAKLVALFSQMRSGSGFLNDLGESPDVTSEIGQPTLIVASQFDAAVTPKHPQALARQIANTQLVMTESSSHFLWFGEKSEQEREAVAAFLRSIS